MRGGDDMEACLLKGQDELKREADDGELLAGDERRVRRHCDQELE